MIDVPCYSMIYGPFGLLLLLFSREVSDGWAVRVRSMLKIMRGLKSLLILCI
jgi:hypothetical protein